MKNLIGDIGGTHTRLAVFEDSVNWDEIKKYRNDDFSSLEEIITLFLKSTKLAPTMAAFSIAGPVFQGEVSLTNRPWHISAAKLQSQFNLQHCQVINDFSAVVMGIPALSAENLEQIGWGKSIPNGPIAVLGPGTGLGVGGMMPDAMGGHIVVSEGGHATLPATDSTSAEIIDRMRQRFGHVSAERAISGPGLQNLYHAIAEQEGIVLPKNLTPAEIGEAATEKEDPIAIRALDYFFAWLGTVAGDLALTYGAKGGVYIAGNIVSKYLIDLHRSQFRQRFENKGRVNFYMRAIPTFVILHPEVELLGLASSINARKNNTPWPYT